MSQPPYQPEQFPQQPQPQQPQPPQPQQQPPYGAPGYGPPGYGPPAYGAPYAPPNTYPAPPKKPRPSAWWFTLPAALLVLAIVAFAAFGVAAFRSFRFDGPVAVDGQPHAVTLDNTEPHVLWAASPRPTCQVADAATGKDLPLQPPTGSFTRSTNSRPNDVAWLEFTPTSMSIQVTCTGGDGSDVMVGTRPNIGKMVGSVMGAILAPLALGGLALISLLVLIILFSVRGPRNSRA